MMFNSLISIAGLLALVSFNGLFNQNNNVNALVSETSLNIAFGSHGTTLERDDYDALFYNHIIKNKLIFKDGHEFLYRLDIFAKKVDEINEHNSNPSKTYSLGLNRFSHLTFQEFTQEVGLIQYDVDDDNKGKGYLNGGLDVPMHFYSKTNLRRGANTLPGQTLFNISAGVPNSVDWVSKGAVTPVKNQGQCGSCWTFSTTGALEGAYFLKWGSLESFSEQELVSCDSTDNACNGGWMDSAFDWVKSNGGLATESDYPYVSGDGSVPKCSKAEVVQNPKVVPSGFKDISKGSMEELLVAVAKQPISIAIQANQPSFQSYSGGVLTGKCGTNLDHGVLLVGYGTMNGVDYWKVKNSWGADWGLDGYILIERSSKNLCGILDAASYPIL